MASSLFIDISACGVLDASTQSARLALHGQQGMVTTPRIPDGNSSSSRTSLMDSLFVRNTPELPSASAGFCFPFLA